MPKLDPEIKLLQRSLNRLSLVCQTPLRLGGRLFLAEVKGVLEPALLVDALLDPSIDESAAVAALGRSLDLARPARSIDARWLAEAQRDYRQLDGPTHHLALIERNPRAFRGVAVRSELPRFRAALDRVSALLSAPHEPPSSWFEAALAAVEAVHGDARARSLRSRVEALVATRREARLRLVRRRDALVSLCERRAASGAGFLDAIARDLFDLPRRGRDARVLAAVAKALAHPDPPLPASLPDGLTLPPHLPDAVQIAADAIIDRLEAPSEVRARVERTLGTLALRFPPEGPSLPPVDEKTLDALTGSLGEALRACAGLALSFEKVLTLVETRLFAYNDLVDPGASARMFARWAAAGMTRDELLALAPRADDVRHAELDVDTARAYARWSSRLSPRASEPGVAMALSPDMFTRLHSARREDMAVLGVCLLGLPREGAAREQIARLDATLALFAKSSSAAHDCLRGLDQAPEGLGRRVDPPFARWLGDDPLLDRYLHLRSLLGEPALVSRSLRLDHERAERLAGEIDHLLAVGSLSAPQVRRLDLLSLGVAEAHPDKTRRKLAAAVDRMTARAFAARLDLAIARLLGDAFGIDAGIVTAATRDVFRFYLTTDRNRDLLELLLRAARARPRAYIAPSLPKNQAWLERFGRDLSPWLARRQRLVDVGGKRCSIAFEQDPIEVLRMGVPFDTCLSIEHGSNAPSAVVNALDVNKRVIYLRSPRGTILARKLVAISTRGELLGYRLYTACSVDEADDVARAFDAFIEELCRDAGLRLGNAGSPELIHGGFWYDDGVVEAREGKEGSRADIDALCRHVGLPVLPPDVEPPHELVRSAQRFSLLQRGEHVALAARMIAHLDHPDLLDDECARAVVEALGEAAIVGRGAPSRGALRLLLLGRRHLGPLALLRTARRHGLSVVDEGLLATLLAPLDHPFEALRETALLALDPGRPLSPSANEPFEWLGTIAAVRALAARFSTAQVFELTGLFSPVLARLDAVMPVLAPNTAEMRDELFRAALTAFWRRPEPAVIARCLRDERASPEQMCVVMHIVARCTMPWQPTEAPLDPLDLVAQPPAERPWVRAALLSAGRRHPSLARSTTYAAALLRHGHPLEALATPEDGPLAPLLCLLPHVEGLEAFVADSPLPQRDDSLSDRAVRLLGDVEGLSAALSMVREMRDGARDQGGLFEALRVVLSVVDGAARDGLVSHLFEAAHQGPDAALVRACEGLYADSFPLEGLSPRALAVAVQVPPLAQLAVKRSAVGTWDTCERVAGWLAPAARDEGVDVEPFLRALRQHTVLNNLAATYTRSLDAGASKRHHRALIDAHGPEKRLAMFDHIYGAVERGLYWRELCAVGVDAGEVERVLEEQRTDAATAFWLRQAANPLS